jgi:hypothetical protein
MGVNVSHNIGSGNGMSGEFTRAEEVIGPDGRRLPPPDTKHWVAQRKAEVVAAVRGGLISLEQACSRYIGQVDAGVATIRSFMLLRDENGDDRWTGRVTAAVLFFGPAPSGLLTFAFARLREMMTGRVTRRTPLASLHTSR